MTQSTSRAAHSVDRTLSRIELEKIAINPESLTPTIRLLTSHESIRDFESTPLADEALEAILVSARSAPTSSNLQAYSIVVVKDPDRRARLSQLVGDQEFVAQAPVMLLFCADIARLQYVSRRQGHHFAADTLEMFLLASVDASLALQNALVAAESLGLGAVPVGSVRNEPLPIARELGLPVGVFAVAGLSLGYPKPDVRRGPKPRLPRAAVVHYEQYGAENLEDHLREYDTTMIANGLYEGRHVATDSSNNAEREYGWAEHTARRTSKPETLSGKSAALREHLKESVESRGFTIR